MRQFETLENKTVIAITGMGLVIGKIAEGDMINPRVLEAERTDDQTKLGLRFKSLLGNPEVFYYSYGQYYISENAELNELYASAVNPNRIIMPKGGVQ